MMGAGKSTVGRILAEMLDLPFFDSDEEVERAAGKTVAEIFDSGGEAAFRAEERRALDRLVGGPCSVIAAGGGAMLDGSTRALILERCTTVWLKVDPSTLARRLAGCSDRPLLQSGDPEQMLRRLLAERERLYAAAAIHVATGDETPSETAAAILAQLSAAAPSPAPQADREADCQE